jgi:hypothetical protein
MVQRCRLQCKARGNGFFELVVVVLPPVSKEGFQMQEQFGAKDPGVKVLSLGQKTTE